MTDPTSLDLHPSYAESVSLDWSPEDFEGCDGRLWMGNIVVMDHGTLTTSLPTVQMVCSRMPALANTTQVSKTKAVSKLSEQPEISGGTTASTTHEAEQTSTCHAMPLLGDLILVLKNKIMH